jgi:hypothetical protein
VSIYCKYSFENCYLNQFVTVASHSNLAGLKGNLRYEMNSFHNLDINKRIITERSSRELKDVVWIQLAMNRENCMDSFININDYSGSKNMSLSL